MVAIHFKRFMLFLGLWLVLTGGSLADLPPGLLAAAGATWLANRLARDGESPLRLLPLLLLLPGFLWRSFLGGADVARRALSQRLAIEPGWIRFRTRLPEGPARVALGTELSLTPGTLAAGSDGQDMLIHCLDASDAVRASIAAEEQRLLAAAGLAGRDPADRARG